MLFPLLLTIGHFAANALGGLERTRERFDWAGFVTREYDLEGATQALNDMRKQSVLKALIRPGA